MVCYFSCRKFQTWLSPPVALSAYFLKGVVPEWDLKDIYLWNDAIYGSSSNWINYNNSISQNSALVTNTVVWTVVNNCLLSIKCVKKKAKK